MNLLQRVIVASAVLLMPVVAKGQAAQVTQAPDTAQLSVTPGSTAPASARDDVVYATAGIMLPVYVKVPHDYNPALPATLVIALHGKGGTAQGLLPMWDAFKDPHFILAVAEAPYPLSGGWSWDFPSEDRRLWDKADPLISEYIITVIREIKTQYRIGAVYLFGHSQGVSYAYLTGLSHPGQIRGLICFAGIYPEEFLPAGQVKAAAGTMRFFIAHGRSDPMIDVKVSERAKGILESMGANVRMCYFNGGHALPAEALREAQEWIEADATSQGKR